MDWQRYLNENPDVRNCNEFNSLEGAKKHYKNYGKNEGRKVYYLNDNQLIFKNLIKKKNNNNFLKYLIVTDFNLNYTAGNTIWLSNLINNLNKENIHITVISDFDKSNNLLWINNYLKNLNNDLLNTDIIKKNTCNFNFIRNIENKEMFNLITVNNYIKFIEEFHVQFNKIIIRSLSILDKLININYYEKLIIYGLDIHLNKIRNLNNKFFKIWTQSEKLLNLFVNNKIDKNKIKITPPIAYKYNFNIEKNIENQIVYCGTLRDEENIIEIIEDFLILRNYKCNIKLKIIFGKIVGDDKFKEKINFFINTYNNIITFKKNLNHKDACYEIATSNFGICWRKNGWGSNGEISTKVKEYENYDLKIIDKSLLEYFNVKLELDNIFFLYGAKQIDIDKKINYIKNYIKSISNIKLFKCREINNVIDNKIKKIKSTSDLILIENCKSKFKNDILEKLNEFFGGKKNCVLKRINSIYQYGHIDSFIKILNLAKKNNLNEIIIFEDDIYIHKKLNDYIKKFFIIKQEVDIIYFGCSKHNNYLIDNINKKCNNLTGTFAIYLKNTIFDDFLELLNLYILPSDICLQILQKKFKTFAFQPDIIISDLENSTISKRKNINYLYEKFKWNINNYVIG